MVPQAVAAYGALAAVGPAVVYRMIAISKISPQEMAYCAEMWVADAWSSIGVNTLPDSYR